MRSLTIIAIQTINGIDILTCRKEDDFKSYPDYLTIEEVCYVKTSFSDKEVYYRENS